MIQTQLALIRRELWEHRSIYVTPAAIGIIVSLLMVTGQVAVSAMGQHVDFALLGATALGENERAAALTGLMTLISLPMLFAMWILTIFYTLDSLYAERKDRSILFWRSIPVTDAETVTSKLLTALIVIPLITLLMIVVTQLMVLIITSVWVSIRGADAWYLIWSAAPLFDTWIVTLVVLLAVPLWWAPFIGWFLFVSAFTKRSPFLTAFMPLIVLPMLEKIFLNSSYLATAFADRLNLPLFTGTDLSDLKLDNMDEVRTVAESGISLLSLLDLSGYFANPGLWAGMAVCGLLVTAAIYLRRYRDDS